MRPKTRASLPQANHRSDVKLFIILLWIFLLKLQHFTTLCEMWNAIHMQFIIETDICINLTFAWIAPSPQGTTTKNPPKVSYHIASTIKLLNLLTLFSFSLLLKWKEKFYWKIVPFQFPCHHVISMRNICAMAKWPVDKTPTLSDVLFSIPLRQNQNNRTAANKNKITFPISIPDRENLQEKELGKEPEWNNCSYLHSW